MDYDQKIKKIADGGLLASWEFPQAEWDEFAALFTEEKPPWKLALKAFLPFVLFLLFMNIYQFAARAPGPQATPQQMTVTYIVIAALGVLIGGLAWFYRWFTYNYFPRPRKGERPKIVMGKKGVLMGDRLFIWEQQGLRLVEATIIKKDEAHSAMKLSVMWGLGAGTVIVPVPKDRVVESQQIVGGLKIVAPA